MATPSCYAYSDPMFQRAMRLISDITQATQAVVTTTFDHNYETGDIVRIIVPSASGMQQINRQQGTITVIDSTSFSIDIDSTYFEAFVSLADPAYFVRYCAHVVPIGEVNSKLTSATRNVRVQ